MWVIGVIFSCVLRMFEWIPGGSRNLVPQSHSFCYSELDVQRILIGLSPRGAVLVPETAVFHFLNEPPLSGGIWSQSDPFTED